MQYKNPMKGNFKAYNVGSYEEQQPVRIPQKRVYSPKYNPQGAQHFSPRNQSSQVQTGSPRHWKSYLAPELARFAPREEAEDGYDNPPMQSPSGNLKGYSPMYNLRQETSSSSLNAPLREDDRMNGLYDRGGSSQQGRKEQYSRRKEEIMNRIKLLQERATMEDDRAMSPAQLSPGQQSPAQLSQLRILNPGNSEELLNRVIALEQKVENLGLEFDNKLKREVADLEKRLRAELKLR